MIRAPRSSPQTRALFSALLSSGSEWRHGYDLMGETGLKSGTVYPLLMRLADQGILEAEWRVPQPPARAPRHVYRLTGEGRAIAHAMLSSTRSTKRQEART